MKSIIKFTYNKGLYHITLGQYVYHVVPIIARHGKEFYDTNDAHSMFKMTGSLVVARTEKNKSIKLSDHYYSGVKAEIKTAKDLKKFLLSHKPTTVYQDSIHKQFINTLKIWKEPQTT